MKTLSTILNFLSKYKDIVYIVIILLLVMFGIDSCHNRKIEQDISKHNINALLDSIEITQSKLNGVIYSRDALLIDKDDLEKALGVSEKQIKELNKKLDSKVTYIAKLEGTIAILNKQLDSVSYTKIGDSYTIHSKDSNQYYKIGLTSKFNIDTLNFNIYNLTSKLDYLTMPINLTTGLTKDWTIFVNTDNPYVKFTNIQGAVVDKNLYIPKSKRKPWALGIGVGMATGYNLDGKDGKDFYVGPGVFVGITYNFLQW